MSGRTTNQVWHAGSSDRVGEAAPWVFWFVLVGHCRSYDLTEGASVHVRSDLPMS